MWHRSLKLLSICLFGALVFGALGCEKPQKKIKKGVSDTKALIKELPHPSELSKEGIEKRVQKRQDNIDNALEKSLGEPQKTKKPANHWHGPKKWGGKKEWGGNSTH